MTATSKGYDYGSQNYGIQSDTNRILVADSTVTATGNIAALSKAPTLYGDYTITAGNSASDASVVNEFIDQKYVKFAPKSGEIPGPISNPFTDVKETNFIYDAVLWAVEKSITKGTTPTTFRHNDYCTRGQIVTFLYRQLK